MEGVKEGTPKQWVCSACTLINEQIVVACLACGRPGPLASQHRFNRVGQQGQRAQPTRAHWATSSQKQAFRSNIARDGKSLADYRRPMSSNAKHRGSWSRIDHRPGRRIRPRAEGEEMQAAVWRSVSGAALEGVPRSNIFTTNMAKTNGTAGEKTASSMSVGGGAVGAGQCRAAKKNLFSKEKSSFIVNMKGFAAAAQVAALFLPHVSHAWLQQLTDVKGPDAKERRRRLRVFIGLQTVEAARQQQYICEPEFSELEPRSSSSSSSGGHCMPKPCVKVLLSRDIVNASIEGTVLHSSIQPLSGSSSSCSSAHVSVVKGDELLCARNLQLRGLNPICLFASSDSPGGSWLTEGGQGTEGDFWRRSLLPLASSGIGSKDTLKEFGAAYFPSVPVIRGQQELGYAFLPQPFLMSFIGCAAYTSPRLKSRHTTGVGVRERLFPREAEGTKEKFRVMFRAGVVHGHNALVLGAFGCELGNPAEHVAELAKAVLGEREFNGKFQEIVFAIPDDRHPANSLAIGFRLSSDGLLSVFKRVFLQQPR